MSLLGRDYERIAMCSHPKGMHEHVPLRPDEAAPETCFAQCDCKPVVFVRADLHQGAIDERDALATAGLRVVEAFLAGRISRADMDPLVDAIDRVRGQS